MTVNLETARRSLPASMIDRSSYSIFSVIKQAIGKDLTKFSIPVVWNGNVSIEKLIFLNTFLIFIHRTSEFSSTRSRMFRIFDVT